MHHPLRKVAVLGAGVMGAQIAALLANAKVPVLLFDLPTEGASPNALVNHSIERLRTLQPSPLTVLENSQIIQPANYSEHLPLLHECDWVIEAIAERFELKQALYQKIGDHLSKNAIVSTNTSGISIHQLADILPEPFRPRFCGTHFFNPPRYMPLVELIPHSKTDPSVVSALEAALVSLLGKGVIFAKDTPNFIANRVGVFASILSTLHRAEQYQLPYEVVDQLTGPWMGRAKSATYRTIDVVGLDTLGFAIETMATTLPADPWHAYYQVPTVIKTLVSRGALGQKTGSGFYKKEGKIITVYDPKTQNYIPADRTANPEVLAILKEPDQNRRFALLRQHTSPEAQFLWACFSDLFHYSAYHLSSIAKTARDVDLAMRWGYGWSTGPFELWQKAGWSDVSGWLEADIVGNKSLTKAPLPQWVKTLDKGVYTDEGAYSPENKTDVARNKAGIYSRQCFPDPLLNERYDEGKTLFETDAVRLWKLGEDNVGILSFKSKLGTMGQAVLDGVIAAIAYAEESLEGVVIWQRAGRYFSVGANLKEITGLIETGEYDVLNRYIQNFQKTTSCVRYAAIPVVAAVQGFALGGGCELMMHSTRVVAASESSVGLVETGVGLIPAGGGCKEFVRRADAVARGDELIRRRLLKSAFWTLLYGKSSLCAQALYKSRYLQESDAVILNPFELLYVAKQQVLALSRSCYRPPMKTSIAVDGEKLLSELSAELNALVQKGSISAYDQEIGLLLAHVFSGGNVPSGTLLSEEGLLDLERTAFLELTQKQKTQERIQHMLKTGKPLRN